MVLVREAVVIGAICGVVALLLVVWVGGFAVVSVDEADYVAHNEAVLRTVPEYPGAVLARQYSIGIPKPGGFDRNGPLYGSFVTWHTYGVSRPVPVQAIIRHFHRVLAGWEWRGLGPYPGRPLCQATFRKGVAKVYIVDLVNTCSKTAKTTEYGIEVDYGGS